MLALIVEHPKLLMLFLLTATVIALSCLGRRSSPSV